MVDIRLATLADLPFDTLHTSWVRAFSDYQVRIQLSPAELRHMFRQNSVSLDASVGAFAGEELVGFWVNGLRTIGGRIVAYDSGTAIFPEFRGQGIAELMAKRSVKQLRQLGVEAYLLEVITTNERALQIYRKDGFAVTRTLACYNAPEPRFDAEEPAGIVFTGGPFEPVIAPEFPAAEYRPSWQNTLEAAENIRDAVHAVVARFDSAIVGFGLVDTLRARIMQIGIAPDRWEGPLPSAILRRLWEAVDKREIAMINVEEGAARTSALLARNGFELFITQYEMSRSL